MKLSDLLTAEQALKIIELFEDLTKKIENLENEVENIKNTKEYLK